MSLEEDILTVLSGYSATNRCSYSDLFSRLSATYDAKELTGNLPPTLEALMIAQTIKMVNQRPLITMGTFYV